MNMLYLLSITILYLKNEIKSLPQEFNSTVTSRRPDIVYLKGTRTRKTSSSEESDSESDASDSDASDSDACDSDASGSDSDSDSDSESDDESDSDEDSSDDKSNKTNLTASSVRLKSVLKLSLAHQKKQEQTSKKSKIFPDLKVKIVNNDEAVIQWRGLDNVGINNITSYKIEIRKIQDVKTKQCALSRGMIQQNYETIEKDVPGHQSEAVMSGIERGGTYDITVHSFTANGKGPKSETVRIQRP